MYIREIYGGGDLKDRSNRKSKVDYGKYGIIFIIPFFVTFAIFQLYPLIDTFYESLFVKVGSVRHSKIVFGLGNYKDLVFGNKAGYEVWKAMGVTVVLWLLNFIPQILLSLLLAAWFTDIKYKLKHDGKYKVIMYLPNIITAATIAVLFNCLFQNNGPITMLARKVFNLSKQFSFLDKGWASLLIIAFIQFWMWYGNTMIVLCAGIMGISPSLYEASMVDGASSRQQFFSITLPLLKPILQFTLVTSAIGGLQMFDIPQLFNKGGPNVNGVNSTTTVIMLIKKYLQLTKGKIAKGTEDMGRAATYSVVLFVVTLAISMIFFIATTEKKEKTKKVKKGETK